MPTEGSAPQPNEKEPSPEGVLWQARAVGVMEDGSFTADRELGDQCASHGDPKSRPWE